MDLKTLKKAMGVGLLSAAAVTSMPSQAATGQVDVDINLPTILLMYYYSDIILNLDANSLGEYMAGTSGSLCGGTGPDFCSSNSAGTVDVTITGASTDVTGPGLLTPDFENSTINLNLVDAVGVRAIGCLNPYSATFDVSGDAGITSESGVLIADIDGVSCTPTLTLGDLDFDLDLGAITAGTTLVNATLDVTITGI